MGVTLAAIQTSAYPASVGMYDWIVPNTPSTNCLVKVSRFDNTSVYDVSDQAFTITALIQPPTVQFVADITSGLEPLSVQFTDQSTAGTGNITSWLWDFGSGDSSAEQHPLYVYQDPGVYSVSLTVTNSADSTASHIREDYIEVIARVPDIELLSAESMSYGVVYLGDTSAAQNIEVKNVGTAPLNIETVSYLLGETPFALIDAPLPIVLAPDETAILNVVFAPLASGAVSDSIYIHSDADNQPVLAIGLRGNGEYVPPAAVGAPAVQILGNDAIITWKP
jgi:PKD repeat protein